MQITGTLIEKFDIIQITEKFRKREFVIQTNEQYPQEIILQLTQDKCDLIDTIKIGELIDVSINIRGKKYEKNGAPKWFNSIDAWKIDVQYSNRLNTTNTPEPKQIPIENIDPGNEDDLPF